MNDQKKLRPDDEGPLAVALYASGDNGSLILDFGKPITWLGLPKHAAYAFADAVRAAADKLDDVPRNDGAKTHGH